MEEYTQFENEAIILLQKNIHMKKEEFIQTIVKENENKIGFSRPTAYKKLADMIANEDIIQLKPEEWLNYGIEEKDQRSAYIILKKSTEIKKYLDSIFSLLITGDEIDRDVILKEIESYKKQYSLDATQLNTLIDLLDSGDTLVLEAILRIIYEWIVKFKRSPNNKEKLISSLKRTLENHQEIKANSGNLRRHTIALLGWFKQDVVLEQFVKDVRNSKNPSSLEGEYLSEFVAEIIEKNRKILFDLEREMFKEAQKAKEREDLALANEFTNRASCVRRVKYHAMTKLNLANNEYDEQIKMHEEFMDAFDAKNGIKLLRSLREVLQSEKLLRY